MKKEKILMVSCDWKTPVDLIDSLVENLPNLGVHAYSVDTGGDSYQLVLSNKNIGEEKAQDIYNYAYYSENMSEEENKEFEEKYDIEGA